MSENFTDVPPEHLRIAAVDPLELDGDLKSLPKYNEAGDRAWLLDVADRAAGNALSIEEPSRVVAAAALRDLDFVASSLLRHGSDPLRDVAGLEDAMVRMGGVAEMVPRSTITTYAGGNPADYRQRTFTGSDEEGLFIDGLRNSYHLLEVATQGLSSTDLSAIADGSPLKAPLQSVSLGMDAMIESIVDVHRRISPEYFTDVMRPYFEPMTIGGKQYSAAGGGQLQLVALEAMLWGFTADDPVWHGFYEENYPYLSLAQREALDSFHQRNGGQTVLGWLAERAGGPEVDVTVVATLEEVFRKIKKFRFPHRKVAEDNFNLRPEGSVGSGSYTPAVLASLIVRTETNIRGIKGVS